LKGECDLATPTSYKEKMDSTLKEQLARSMFRFRKIGIMFHQGFDVNMGEIALMKGIADNETGLEKKTCVADIQSNLYITKPAISQMYNSLEKKGYITREIDIKDRRKIVAILTPEGQNVLKFMKESSNHMVSEIISRLGEDDTRQLIELFNRFADISEELKNEMVKTDRDDKEDKEYKAGKGDTEYKVGKEDKTIKADKADKADKTDKTDKTGKTDKTDKASKAYKTGKTDKASKAHKAGKVDTTNKTDTVDTTDKENKEVKTDKKDATNKTNKKDKKDKKERKR